MGYSGSFLREFKIEPDFERGDGTIWAKKKREGGHPGREIIRCQGAETGQGGGIRQVSSQRPGVEGSNTKGRGPKQQGGQALMAFVGELPFADRW